MTARPNKFEHFADVLHGCKLFSEEELTFYVVLLFSFSKKASKSWWNVPLTWFDGSFVNSNQSGDFITFLWQIYETSLQWKLCYTGQNFPPIEKTEKEAIEQ